MSKIQPITNYKPNLNQNIRLTPGPSFTGAAVAAADAEKIVLKGVRDEIKSSLGPVGRALNSVYIFLGKHASEIQNQLINAIFTCTLAVWMIRNNPFAKKTVSPNTLNMSSKRQYVSAGIAVSGGVAMTMLIDAYMARLGDDGLIESIDGRMKPSSDYVKKEFKKAFKTAAYKQKFLDSCNPKDFEKIEVKSNGKPKGKYKQACLEGFTKQIHEKRKNLFIALIGENPKNITVNDTKEILINGKRLGENISKLGTQKELEDYLAKNSLYNRQLKDSIDEIKKVSESYFNKSDNKTFKDFVEENFKELKSKNILQELLEGKHSIENRTLGEFLNSSRVGNVEAEVRAFAKGLLNNKLSRIDKDFKNFKGYANVFFNLFTTAITCTILNWAYPKIIEKFYPELLKPDEPAEQKKQPEIKKGGNK